MAIAAAGANGSANGAGASSGGSTGASSGSSSTASGGDTSASESYSSGDTGSESAEGGESSEGGTESSAEASPRYKYRRGGKDYEETGDEIARRLDDDYEHEFHGALGKPLLVDGKPVKLKYAEIVRAVQQHTGAMDAMRRHNESRERIDGLLEWGKQPDNLQAFVEQHFGVEDYDDWIYTHAQKLLARDRQLVELQKSDPIAYQNEIRKLERARFERDQGAKQRLTQVEQARKERARNHHEFWQQTEAALGKIGLRMDARAKAIAESIVREYAAAKAELSFDDLADMTRTGYRGEIVGHLDGLDDSQLLGLLGDRRRERLRQAELSALKGKKAEQKKTEPKPATSAPKRMTADEFLRGGRK